MENEEQGEKVEEEEEDDLGGVSYIILHNQHHYQPKIMLKLFLIGQAFFFVQVEFALVEMEKLKRLFRFCSNCGSPTDNVHLTRIGSALSVNYDCRGECGGVKWESQSVIGSGKVRRYKANHLLPAAAFISGMNIPVNLFETHKKRCRKESSIYNPRRILLFFRELLFHPWVIMEKIPEKQIFRKC